MIEIVLSMITMIGVKIKSQSQRNGHRTRETASCTRHNVGTLEVLMILALATANDHVKSGRP